MRGKTAEPGGIGPSTSSHHFGTIWGYLMKVYHVVKPELRQLDSVVGMVKTPITRWNQRYFALGFPAEPMRITATFTPSGPTKYPPETQQSESKRPICEPIHMCMCIYIYINRKIYVYTQKMKFAMAYHVISYRHVWLPEQRDRISTMHKTSGQKTHRCMYIRSISNMNKNTYILK